MSPPVWRRHATFVLTVIGLALLARVFFIQAFAVPSRSMEDTLLTGDYLLVDKLTYGPRVPFLRWRLPGLSDGPRPGDIVAFEYPLDPRRVYFKRCIAVGGQTVEVRDKVVYVDGRRQADPPLSKFEDARILPAADNPRDNYGPKRVPDGTIFVIGDNRDNSRDSRHWGCLPTGLIIGRARWVYWSCEMAYLSRSAGGKTLLSRVVSLPERIRWRRLSQWVE
jgi:signal peptidase I